MAEINTVPLGRAGTGAAFELGQDQSSQLLVQDLMKRRDEQFLLGQMAAKEDYARRQAAEKTFQDNMIKAKGGMFWQPEINQRISDYVSRAAEARAKGINLFAPNWNDPDQVQAYQDAMKEKNAIEGMQDAAEKYGQNFQEMHKQYSANPSKYDPSWLEESDKLVNGTKLADILANGQHFPDLREQFDPQSIVKAITPAVNEEERIVPDGKGGYAKMKVAEPDASAVQTQVKGFYQNNPAAKADIEKKIGMPISRLEGTTDMGKLLPAMDDFLRTPEGVKLLAQTPNAPKFGTHEYDQMVHDMALHQQKAEQTYQDHVDGLTDQIVAKGHHNKSALPFFGYADQARSDAANSRAIEKHMAWRKQKNTLLNDDNTRRQWISDIQAQHPGAVDNFQAALAEIGGSIEHQGKQLLVRVPIAVQKNVAVTDDNGDTKLVPQTVYQTQQYHIGTASGEKGRILINQLLNKLKSVGSEQQLKVQPYNPAYDDLGAEEPTDNSTPTSNSADDL